MTSHDFTTYQFDFPTQHWTVGVDLLADVFSNAVFKKDLFNSELCAVVQELKLYKDDYDATLEEEMVSLMFAGHPYHYPVIGYKHELWNLKIDAIANFYHAHYVPNNAIIVVVGDVAPDEVVATVRQYFADFVANYTNQVAIEKPVRDLVQRSISLYRDVERATGRIGFSVPGLSAKKSCELDLLTWIIGRGRGSRLYEKLVDQLACVVSINSYVYEMFERAVLFVEFEPVEGVAFEQIETDIVAEFEHIKQNGLTEYELERAINQVKRENMLLLEDFTLFAEEVGCSYLATSDHEYLLRCIEMDIDKAILKKNIEQIVRDDCVKVYMHTGRVLPMSGEADLEDWQKIQDESDEIDREKRADKIRTSGLEELKHSKQIIAKAPIKFKFPNSKKTQLSNGLDILWHNHNDNSLVTIIVDLTSNHYVDTLDKLGCYSFMFRMLAEGTRQYSAKELAREFEHAGIAIEVRSGCIMMNLFSGSLEKALSLLADILVNSIFDESRIAWVREQIIAEIFEYWDEPSEFIKQYAREQVYKNHAYAKNELGTVETVQAITRDDVVAAYHAYVSPQGAAISIVGDLRGHDLIALLEKTIGSWTGPAIAKSGFSALESAQHKIKEYSMNRDQIVLGFAGLSVAYTDTRYDALLLFDYIFTGGSVSSMGSRLFKLREQSGLFLYD